MNEMVTVRPADSIEASAIAELHRAAIRARGPTAYDEAQVAAWAATDESDYPIEDDEHRFVVAERRDQLLGFGDLHVPAAEVTAVYVHPAHARAGVGTALLDDLERTASEQGLSELGLLAAKNAVGFYEVSGYHRVETRIHEAGDETLDCVWMEKRLD